MRQAVQVTPFSYLSSSAATVDLVSAFLPTTHQSLPTPYSDVALTKWSQGHDGTPPAGAEAMKEKKWDDIVTSNTASTLLEDARSVNESVRLYTVKNEEFKYPLNWGSSFPECPSQYDSVEIIILSISPFL